MSGATIFAQASGAGQAAIAVLRLSGPDSARILDRLCSPRPPPRRACLRRLRDGDGQVLDQAVVLWLPGPGSYTGEDGAELHLHGSRAVVEAVAAALVSLGARPAEPGEFTRRAVLAGRMDLLQAEAVADLVQAQTAAQRRQALDQLDNGLGDRLRDWHDRLRTILAHQEALIDFPEEALPADMDDALGREMSELCGAMRALLSSGRGAERIRNGLLVVLGGPPNAGKSSLMNRLAGREAAIVSDRPGTTRDLVEAAVELAGLPVTLVDTAGLRDSDDPVEREGVRRARACLDRADLVLDLAEAGVRREVVAPASRNGDASVRLDIATKIDLWPDILLPDGVLGVSAVTGRGLDELRCRMQGELERLAAAGPSALTRPRHRAALQDASSALERARVAAWPELRGEELRLAMQALGRITGMVGVEALLDTVFSSFCIGK